MQILSPGDEFAVADPFLPQSFAAYAAMVMTQTPDVPAVPAIVLDLEGWVQSELGRPELERVARLVLERPLAEEMLLGITKALELLDNIRNNQEGPDQ